MLELRQAYRSLSKSKAFAAVVVSILGLGIGANTAIFSVVRALLLRPLPFQEPERLVRLRESFRTGGDEAQLNLSPLTWQRWRESNDVFTDVAAATGTSLTLSADGDAHYVPAARISHNFFAVLGVRPLLGRDIDVEEDQPRGPRVVLMSHGLWQRRFGGTSDIVGKEIRLDGAPHTVLGVMPASFRHPYRAELWVPLQLRIEPTLTTGRYLYVPARLRPGVTLEQATLSMRRLCERLALEFPSPQNAREATLVPLHRSFVRDIQPKMLAITAAAGFVLLIAGANVASLLLARHLEREREAGVRAALGASRGRLVRESLAQSLLLTIAGCIAGVLLASWLTGPIFALSPMASDATGNAMREFSTAVALDGPVLAVSLATALLVGLGFGLVPAWRVSRGDLHAAVKGGSRSTLERGTRRTFGALVVSEIAVALVLLTATGLMIRSFHNLIGQDWGFATNERLTFDASFSERLRPRHTERVAYVEQALERLRALPGVVSATAVTPELVAFGRNLAGVTPEGSTPPETRGYFLVNHRMVFPGFFEASGMRIVRGRALQATDVEGTQRVAVVSERFVRRFWPNQDPIGKTIKRGRPDDPRPPYTVVGVLADIKGVADPTDGDVPGLWYLPYAQNATFLTNDISFVVHARVPPESLERAARQAVLGVDPAIAPYSFNTLERLVENTYVEDRFALLLIGLFGALGLVLSAIGLYGLLSFQVARRTRELGVRAALGAQGRDILSLVFRDGAALLGAGVGVGVLMAGATTRLLGSQLHDIRPADPFAYLLAVAVLSAAAALASWLPARRAARVDPMIALRSE